MSTQRETFAALKQRPWPFRPGGAGVDYFQTGVPAVDEPLGGGLARAALHEIFARMPADAASASGFGLALAMRSAVTKPLVWVCQDFAESEDGRLHAPGLVELGHDPARLILVRARDMAGVLRAGLEALRCGALGAVGLEIRGEPGLLDFTASRRFSLAAGASGVTAFMVRTVARPKPSAAATRWSVAAAPSRPLLANAPGAPSFAISLLRHRAGVQSRDWHVEWDRDRCSFREGSSLSRPLVSIPPDRSTSADKSLARPIRETGPFRRAG